LDKLKKLCLVACQNSRQYTDTITKKCEGINKNIKIEIINNLNYIRFKKKKIKLFFNKKNLILNYFFFIYINHLYIKIVILNVKNVKFLQLHVLHAPETEFHLLIVLALKVPYLIHKNRIVLIVSINVLIVLEL
jgi:hypothetical protein